MTGTPIACTLDAGNLKERLAWIASLNARALKRFHREGLTLTLDYSRSAIDDVRKMVAGERECCAFLEFRIIEEADLARLLITAPEEAREAAEALFEPFASGGQMAAATHCG